MVFPCSRAAKEVAPFLRRWLRPRPWLGCAPFPVMIEQDLVGEPRSERHPEMPTNHAKRTGMIQFADRELAFLGGCLGIGVPSPCKSQPAGGGGVTTVTNPHPRLSIAGRASTLAWTQQGCVMRDWIQSSMCCMLCPYMEVRHIEEDPLVSSRASRARVGLASSMLASRSPRSSTRRRLVSAEIPPPPFKLGLVQIAAQGSSICWSNNPPCGRSAEPFPGNLQSLFLQHRASSAGDERLVGAARANPADAVVA